MILGAAERAAAWEEWEEFLAGLDPEGWMGWGLFRTAARLAVFLAAGGILSLVLRSGGNAVLGSLRLPARGWERFGLAVLLGFGLLAGFYLGLSLTGLFYPATVVVAAAAFLALPPYPQRLPPAGFGRERAGWLLAAIVPFLAAVTVATAPDVNVDAYCSHLAVPDTFLKAHKYVIEGTSMSFKTPLAAEHVYALALVVGRDELAHFLELVPFLAAVAVLGIWAGRTGGPWAGVAAVALIVTMGTVERQAVIVKNCLVAAAFPMAGAACALRGIAAGSAPWLAASGLMMGCAAATKFNGYALLPVMGLMVAGALAGKRTGWRSGLAWAAGAALPWSPWLVRDWLYMGDPLWPFLARWLPGAVWEPEWLPAMEAIRGGGGVAAWLRTAGPGLVDAWLVQQPIVALVLPAALLLWRRAPGEARWMALFSAAGFAVLWFLMSPTFVRLGIPVLATGAAALSVIVAGGLRGWPARRLRVLGAVAVAALWLPLPGAIGDSQGCNDYPALRDFLAGRLDRDAFLARQLTTYGEFAREASREAGLRRSMTLGGDVRFYLLPGRNVYEKFWGRDWAWALSRECATAGRIRARLRQLDCRHFTYNFVTEGFPHPYTAAFPWDDRMLRLWTDFVGRHLEIVVQPRYVDRLNGGFLMYRLRAVPLSDPPARLGYLPGIAGLYHPITRHGVGRGAWVTEAEKLRRRLPNVDYVSDLAGFGHAEHGRWREAYDRHLPGVGRGTVNDGNFYSMGIAAKHLRRWEMARSCLRRSADIYPGMRAGALLNLGEVCFNWAVERRQRGEVPGDLLEEAERALRAAMPGRDGDAGRFRSGTLACVLGLRADLLREAGRGEEAVSLYREAIGLAPHLEGAAFWRRRVDLIRSGM